MIEKYRKVCIHEASHLVFSRILKQLNVDFPDSKSVQIVNEEQGWTVGGMLNQTNTPIAYRQRKELEEKSLEIKLFQIIYSISGYISSQLFIDESFDECELENFQTSDLAMPSDLEKCNLVASMISDTNGAIFINEPNLIILNKIKIIVQNIMKEKIIKQTIVKVAEKLCQAKHTTIEENEMVILLNEIDKGIANCDFEEIKKQINYEFVVKIS